MPEILACLGVIQQDQNSWGNQIVSDPLQGHVKQRVNYKSDSTDISWDLWTLDTHCQKLLYGFSSELNIFQVLSYTYEDLAKKQGEGLRRLFLPGIDEFYTLVSFFSNCSRLEFSLNKESYHNMYLLLFHHWRYLFRYLKYFLEHPYACLSQRSVPFPQQQHLPKLCIYLSLHKQLL